jgi:flagellar motor protein MotB
MLYARTLGYKPSLIEVPEDHEAQFSDAQLDVRLQPSIVLPATIQLFNKSTGTPVSERGIICYNNDGETQIMSTDVSGSFKLILQEDQHEYWIRFPDGQFLTESITINEEQKHYTMDIQPIDEQLFEGWLFFKRGSVEAIEMSRALIPRIAAVINANPGMTFRIEGFYDTVYEAYQPNLDIQRAEHIVKRLVDEGVNESQLVAVAGADKPDKPEEEDANWRKVEIKIQR